MRSSFPLTNSAAATTEASRAAEGSHHASKENGHPSADAYRPVSSEDVKSVTFKWIRAGPMYQLRGTTVYHQGGGVYPYRPVIGDLCMMPDSGLYYYEFRVNTDNCRVGLCTENAYPANDKLESTPLGELPPGDVSANSRTANSAPLVVYMELSTSKVYVNGVELKHLYRLFVASCGALLSFVVDTDEGVVQLFVDKKYAGLVFDGKAQLRGRTLFPCIGLSGVDQNNRNIGTGYQSSTISPSHRFDCLY